MDDGIRSKLSLIKDFCVEYGYIYDEGDLIKFLERLKEHNLLDEINDNIINSHLRCFRNSLYSISKTLWSIFLPNEFHDEDIVGFYTTMNRNLESLIQSYGWMRKPDESSIKIPLYRELFKKIISFESGIPDSLKAKYGWQMRDIIRSLIVYRNLSYGNEDITSILYRIIDQQSELFEFMAINEIYNPPLLVGHDEFITYYNYIESMYQDFNDALQGSK